MGMSTGLANALLDAAAGYNTVFDSGKFRMRTGSMPSDADQAPTGTLLVDGSIPADAFAAAAARSIAKNGTWSSAGLAAAGAGTNIGWLRLETSGDGGGLSTTDKRHDFTVGIPGAQISITGAALQAGQVEITANAHGLSNGDMVEITGHSVAALNRKWIVNTVAANTFRIPTNVTPGTGGTARKSFECTVDNTNVAQGQVITITSLTIAL